jgi:hypothetical protein
MATPTNNFVLAIACLGVIATPALADHIDGKKHYHNNQPYYDEMSRSDFIALNAGDAPQANIAIQADDVWPSYINDTHFHTDGRTGEKTTIEFLKRRASPPNQPAPSIVINTGGAPPAAP